jgi:hypothetical protein
LILAFDAQGLCIIHSHCAFELGLSKDSSNTQVAACQLLVLEQVFYAVLGSSTGKMES